MWPQVISGLSTFPSMWDTVHEKEPSWHWEVKTSKFGKPDSWSVMLSEKDLDHSRSRRTVPIKKMKSSLNFKLWRPVEGGLTTYFSWSIAFVSSASGTFGVHVPFEGHFSIGKCLILMKYDFPFFSFLGNFLSCVRPLYQAQQPRDFSPSFFFFFFFFFLVKFHSLEICIWIYAPFCRISISVKNYPFSILLLYNFCIKPFQFAVLVCVYFCILYPVHQTMNLFLHQC